MRSLHAAVVLAILATAPAARACPRAATCAITLDVRAIDRAAPRLPRPLQLALAPRPARAPAWSFARVARADADAPAVPWIWQVVRAKIYAQLPRYTERSLSFTLAPVVVAGSFDTVPGLGIAGDF